MGSYVGRVLDASHPAHYQKHSPKVATEKQVAFIKRLLDERVVDDEYVHWLLCQIESGDLMSSGASVEIAVLMGKPKKNSSVRAQAHKPNVEAVEGFYTYEGNTYEVKTSKTGHKYAMLLVVKEIGTCGGCEACDGENACKKVKASWKYEQGAMKNFQKFVRMTVEQAAEFGHKFGVCMCCGRTLTNPESIARGIGPICAEGF